jgi:hypothetical protein
VSSPSESAHSSRFLSSCVEHGRCQRSWGVGVGELECGVSLAGSRQTGLLAQAEDAWQRQNRCARSTGATSSGSHSSSSSSSSSSAACVIGEGERRSWFGEDRVDAEEGGEGKGRWCKGKISRARERGQSYAGVLHRKTPTFIATRRELPPISSPRCSLLCFSINFRPFGSSTRISTCSSTG